MFIHHTFKTPIKKKVETISCDVSQIFEPSTEKSKQR